MTSSYLTLPSVSMLLCDNGIPGGHPPSPSIELRLVNDPKLLGDPIHGTAIKAGIGSINCSKNEMQQKGM